MVRNKILKKAALLASTSLLALSLNSNAQSVNTKQHDYNKYESVLGDLYLGNERFGVMPLVEFDFGARVSKPIIQVSNIPESIRLVPIHPEDKDVNPSNNGPIADAPLNNIWIIDVASVKMGLSAKVGNLEFETAIRMNFSPTVASSMYSRNYTNNPGTSERGNGAALTYYRADCQASLMEKIVEISFPLNIPETRTYAEFNEIMRMPRLMLGVSQRSLDVGIETGYDRYNSLTTEKFHYLENLTENSIYGGLAFRAPINEFSLDLRILAGHNKYIVKDIKYSDVNIQLNNKGWFGAVNLGFRF
jgi:hypothetical protein